MPKRGRGRQLPQKASKWQTVWPIERDSRQGFCLCGNIARECAVCALTPLSKCEACGVSGPADRLAEHFLDNHVILKSNHADIWQLRTELQPWVCQCGFSTFVVEDLEPHYKKCHVVDDPAGRPPGCVHKFKQYVGDFCRGCMVRVADDGWACAVCGMQHIRGPDRHWKLHVRVARHYLCSMCNEPWIKHHMHCVQTPACELRGCELNMGRKHMFTFKCQLCPGTHTLKHFKRHTQACELHNAVQCGIVDKQHAWPRLSTVLESRSVDTSDLVWTTTKFPWKEMYRRAEMACAPGLGSPRSYDNLPHEMWKLICQYLDVRALGMLRAVSTGTHAAVDAVCPGLGHFIGKGPDQALTHAVLENAPLPTSVKFIKDVYNCDDVYDLLGAINLSHNPAIADELLDVLGPTLRELGFHDLAGWSSDEDEDEDEIYWDGR